MGLRQVMMSGMLESQPLQFCDRHKHPRLNGASMPSLDRLVVLPHAWFPCPLAVCDRLHITPRQASVCSRHGDPVVRHVPGGYRVCDAQGW